jgi:DNA excision repair protein ERCC-1
MNDHPPSATAAAAPSAASNAGTSSSSAAASVNINPYAKKNKHQQQLRTWTTTQLQQPPPRQTNTTNTTIKPASRSNNDHAQKPSGSSSSGGGGTVALPSLLPVTFSQAFPYQPPGDGNDDDATSVVVAAAAATATATAATAEAGASLATNTNTTNTNSVVVNNINSNNGNNDVRDYHLQFQPHVLYVSTRQRGNTLLKHIRNVPFSYSEMLPDYVLGPTTCALFLSLRYHQLYPHYVQRRIDELGKDFKIRILLVLVDVDDSSNALLVLNRLCVTHSLSLWLSWSDAEAARYLETAKALGGKDATSIQKRESKDVADQMCDFLTSCKPLSRTDAASLWGQFGHLANLADRNVTTSRDALSLCPGMGPIKVHRLWDALHRPFSKRSTRERVKKRRRKMEEQEEQDQQQKEHQKQQTSEEDGEGEGGTL